ncbi:MAG: signal peptidase II [Acidiferrobacterales bacterium]|nr:signal peptidase II [Acidiferrobacterales bacterium]
MFRLGWIAALVIVLDQVAKWLAVTYLTAGPVILLPVLKLVLVHNRGAAFGFLDQAPGWQNGLFIAIALIVSVVILGMIRKLEGADLQVRIALWAVIGGALGNLVDRIRVGAVIDFIQVSQYFPVFNIADSAITLGATLLVMDALGINIIGKKVSNAHGKN